MIYQEIPQNFSQRFHVVSCYLQHEGDFLLLHRLPHKSQGDRWGVPAGKVDGKENERSAMSRELREETGLAVSPEAFEYFTKIPVRHGEYDFMYTMFSTKLVTMPTIQVNPLEHQDFTWVSPSEALRMRLVEDLDECIRMFYRI